ncbi:Putative monooxygenase [Poriferisphaera corsica]|uniref:Monooxygenase n=1 Tax=Poriferisphaera corsica TaxID=2528020 RepID=A0A517YYR4_9BACT|nr:putative quinol monooxygenase [Poriferisphaera corsica]QDU35374.1 Putative monooxygenase [Poriferisphaera corsica]
MSTSPLTIIAKVIVKSESREELESELFALLEPSRKDPGCVLYDLHQSDEDPNLFLFYETWESKPLWEAHMETPHLKHWRAISEGKIADFELLQMTKK